MKLPPIEFEDVVFDEATRRCGNESPIWRGFVDGAEWGAGWAFAIVGMAQAIRDNSRYIKLDAERVKREAEFDWMLKKALAVSLDALDD